MDRYIEVYLDVVLLKNLVVNYLILMLTAKFTRTKVSSLRLFTGSLIGTLYVIVLVLLPNMKAYNTIIAKVLLSFAIIAVTFYPRKAGEFIKTLSIFYISTFIYAGAAFAFIYFVQGGGIVKNGVMMSFNSSIWEPMIFSIIVVGIIVKIFLEIYQNRTIRDKLLIPLKIAFESRIIDLSALVDTGNSLHDPLTNMPVIVVEFKAIKDILPSEIQSIFVEAKENDLGCVTRIVSKSAWFSRFRLIPFSSLGKENGMLIGFKPDYIEIGESEGKKGVSDVVVGIYNRTLSRNENYKALLSPDLIA